MTLQPLPPNPKILIVSTGYNCAKYVKPCLDSIKAQTYKNYCVYVVNDGSTDNTREALYIETLTLYGKTLQGMNLHSNQGTYYARDKAIEMAKQYFDYHIIALLDMDDELLPNALQKVVDKYNEGNVLMTYGNYKDLNGKAFDQLHYSNEVHEARSYRRDKFRCTHLRTFRKELYEAIPKWELTQGEINSYPDAEILFSMMEMCGKSRIGVIDEPIYIYKTDNPLQTLRRFGKDHAGYNEICSRDKRELI